MAVHLNHFELHKEAMTETLQAAQILIEFRKQDSDKWTNSEGCLGYPALALLLTYINSFGNLFNGVEIEGETIRNDKSTFFILNSKYFAQQKLSKNCIDDFYESYRNKIIHNLSLPKNCFIEIQSTDKNWCLITTNGNKEAITTVFVNDLLNLCLLSFDLIKKEHEQFYINSKKIKDIYFIDKFENGEIHGLNSSGVVNFEK